MIYLKADSSTSIVGSLWQQSSTIMVYTIRAAITQYLQLTIACSRSPATYSTDVSHVYLRSLSRSRFFVFYVEFHQHKTPRLYITR